MELDELRFSPEHVWVYLVDGHEALIGLSEKVLEENAEVTKIRLVGEGEEIIKDEPFGRLTTAIPNVVRLYAPISGEVIEVNDEVLESPDLIMEDPYDEGWLLRIEVSNMAEYDDLMTDEEYESFLDDDELPEEEEEDIEDDEDLDEDEDLDDGDDEDY